MQDSAVKNFRTAISTSRFRSCQFEVPTGQSTLRNWLALQLRLSLSCQVCSYLRVQDSAVENFSADISTLRCRSCNVGVSTDQSTPRNWLVQELRLSLSCQFRPMMESQLEGKSDSMEGDACKNNDENTKVGTKRHREPRIELSVPQFETVDGSYNFTLTGYSLAKGVGSGKYFSSGTFAVGGHEWAIYFYPDGKKRDGDHSDFVSVFIVLASESFNVQALFELALLDRSGRGKHKVHTHFTGRIKSPYTLQSHGAMWGYKRYFRRAALETSDYLKDDTLEFKGRVGVLLSSVRPTKLITNTVSPLPQEDNASRHQSSSSDEPSSHNFQATGSQSEDALVSKFKQGLGLEGELARYHLKLLSSQSPTESSNSSDPEKQTSTSSDGTVA